FLILGTGIQFFSYPFIDFLAVAKRSAVVVAVVVLRPTAVAGGANLFPHAGNVASIPLAFSREFTNRFSNHLNDLGFVVVCVLSESVQNDVVLDRHSCRYIGDEQTLFDNLLNRCKVASR